MKWFRRRTPLARRLRDLLRGAALDPAWGADWPALLEKSPRWPVWSRLRVRLERFSDLLEDEKSRDILARLLAHQLLGAERFPLPVPGGGASLAPWRDTGSAPIPSGFRDIELRAYDLSAAGYPLSLYLGSERPNTVFDLEQYAERDLGVFVREGDVVIDGGGCWGDSAHYFAEKAGAAGKVFSFEFLPSNLAIFRRNVELNPGHAARIDVVEKALWKDSDTRFSVIEAGPATRVKPLGDDGGVEPDALVVEGTSLDDFSTGRGLKIDFVKLDIEGAEPLVLEGARGLLKRDRPRLAVCVYHDPEHYVSLAEYIDGLGLGYRFSLRHFTDCSWETVLFARTGSRG